MPAVDYRRAPEHPYPAAVEDVTAVLRWARPAAVAGGRAPASPLLTADLSGMPDALIVTAEHDALRDEGDAYARRLAQAGVRVTHRQEPGLEHGFIQNMDLTSAQAAAAHERPFEDIRSLTRRSR